jgi:hypothetical protein
LQLKPVDLAGEIELQMPRSWTCRWLGSGRWWCGEDEEHGLGVFLRQELTDPRPSEPGDAPTPLANAAYRAGETREALEGWRPDSPVSDRKTLSGHLLHCSRVLVWEGHRARQLRWFAIDGYSTATAVLDLVLNIPEHRLADPDTAALVSHFAREAEIGNRLPPSAEGTLRLRDLRIEEDLVVGVPAEWRCEGDGDSVRCRIVDPGMSLLITAHRWDRAELLARIDPPPLDDVGVVQAVADHFNANMPAGFETGPVEPAGHGAVFAAREVGQGGGDLETADKLFWIHVLVGPSRVTCVWFTLFLPPGGIDHPALPELQDRIAACVRGLRPAGLD